VSGTFVTLERPGGGGMGVVYRTHDEPLDRDVRSRRCRKNRARNFRLTGNPYPRIGPKRHESTVACTVVPTPGVALEGRDAEVRKAAIHALRFRAILASAKRSSTARSSAWISRGGHGSMIYSSTVVIPTSRSTYLGAEVTIYGEAKIEGETEYLGSTLFNRSSSCSRQ
jgi:hypothetical protein